MKMVKSNGYDFYDPKLLLDEFNKPKKKILSLLMMDLHHFTEKLAIFKKE